MANVFTKYTGIATTTGTNIKTVEAGKKVVIIGFMLANKSTSQKKATVLLNSLYLANEIPIPASSTLSILDGKIIMEAGDTIVVEASEDSSIDVVVSVLEQT